MNLRHPTSPGTGANNGACTGAKAGSIIALTARWSSPDGYFDQLGGAIGQAIPRACQDWANTKAAYRFFFNSRVIKASSA
ncbi:IS4/Tn5 family transposase DNA-binding protein [Paramagnetospirillum magneticum]